MDHENLDAVEAFAPLDESDLIWMQSCLYDVENESQADFDLDCYLNAGTHQEGGVSTRSQTRSQQDMQTTDDTRLSEQTGPANEHDRAVEGMSITKVSQKKNTKFNMKSSTYTVEIVDKETEDVQQAIVQVVKNIDEILDTVLMDADDKIEKVAQSNKEFLLKGRFKVEVTLVVDQQSRGSGLVEDWLAAKTSDPQGVQLI
ncbi:hypothetical protein AC249_AIPGENE7872 [Exaiptasia diaphana]|nr:hypothetical protein AC249_AIPGENE7872 [Exaiptasia diaphana]